MSDDRGFFVDDNRGPRAQNTNGCAAWSENDEQYKTAILDTYCFPMIKDAKVTSSISAADWLLDIK